MDQSEKFERLADDLLLGAGRIAAFLTDLTGEEVTEDDVYYLASKRSKTQWPISRFGPGLIASKKELAGHISGALESRSRGDVVSTPLGHKRTRRSSGGGEVRLQSEFCALQDRCTRVF